MVSSLLVLWRFKTGHAKEFETTELAMEQKAAREANRERTSTLGIAGVFFFFAAVLFIESCVKLGNGSPNDDEESDLEKGAQYALGLSITSGIFFAFLTYFKYKLAKQSGSTVLMKDAICSALGVGLAVVVAFSAIFEEQGIWYADPIAALVISGFMVYEGSRTCVQLKQSAAAEEQKPKGDQIDNLTHYDTGL
jgi:divalent metal cation (Fe/Co/Zn/Cd) transporter